jgi:hypothetical protein
MATLIDDSLQLGVSDTHVQPEAESAWVSPASYWHFSEAHLEILARFRDRTALTIGDKSLAPAYRDLLCQLAMTVRLYCLYSSRCKQLIILTARLPYAHAPQLDADA